MINPTIADVLVHEQNYRIQEQYSIAQASNKMEQKTEHSIPAGSVFNRFPGRQIMSHLSDFLAILFF